MTVYEDERGDVHIKNLTSVYVSTRGEVLSAITAGSNNRKVARTNQNAQSSRSHSIFVLRVTQRNTQTNVIRVGKLYLVDLAGSERLKRSKVDGVNLMETRNINQSLSSLGNVINALTTSNGNASSERHIPYRDSKLTRILKESLGGNAKTHLIIMISPSMDDLEESTYTLRFGLRYVIVNDIAIKQLHNP